MSGLIRYIFDMDGTLYRLNSPGNKYEGSSLQLAVENNARRFLLSRGFASIETVEQVMSQGLSDLIGLSAYIQRQYSVTRSEYFNEVWDINPDGMIQDYNAAVSTIKVLARTSSLILLTSAAKVWQQRVCNYLGITDLFDTVITGEDFDQKEEVFERIAREAGPADTYISIGDQEKTDILPAQAVGMRTFLVANPDDLKLLLEAKS